MRHGRKIHKLDRPAAHRHALISNLASALLTHNRIKTTEAKARALRPVVEKLITTAKQNTLHARRQVAKTIRSKELVAKLFNEIAPQMADRSSGYARIMKLAVRKGDGAQIAMIELLSTKSAAHEETGKKGKGKKGQPASKSQRGQAKGKDSKAAKPENTAKGAEDSESSDKETEA